MGRDYNIAGLHIAVVDIFEAFRGLLRVGLTSFTFYTPLGFEVEQSGVSNARNTVAAIKVRLVRWAFLGWEDTLLLPFILCADLLVKAACHQNILG